MIVFDSGAIIALVNAEPGALLVRRLLRSHKGACVIHAVNTLEIFYGYERAKGTAFARRVLEMMAKAGIETRGDFDQSFLEDASFLKTNYKMSLADTFGVALCRRLASPLATTDHHELDAIDAARVAQILFIR